MSAVRTARACEWQLIEPRRGKWKRSHVPDAARRGAQHDCCSCFGPKDYAYRLGLIGAPSRIAQALAPLGFGLLIEPLGRGVLVVSSMLCVAALIALLLLRRGAQVTHGP